ncbi:hypothetical protein GGTG_13659 [Gaeumannomyces tritici R3-111a-1]|uniref:Uncharacterized protein n=1 Tax=Gaeumannomyces tritici (strain R3-111a-1) TaxID=644352 RepID=J3PJH7_GAET3|nr:hypothetical protein GGTG_13659 [Gaeumannomyces tritici R3-111a-1]EJT68768.1 hypothetical protein GGTG_13659 [Gaeumannomyces tritici R3-111a-1]
MSSKMTEYPQPLVVPPRQLPHKQTFIILHDRGWWADKFGPALPETAVPTPSPSPRTLAPIFPHANGSTDNWKLDPPAAAEREGPLGAGPTQHHRLPTLPDPGRRGCAASLVSLLLWEGPRAGCGGRHVRVAVVLRARMREQLDGGGEAAEGEDDLSQREDEDEEKEPARVAVDWLREELGLPSVGIGGDGWCSERCLRFWAMASRTTGRTCPWAGMRLER